MVNEIRNIDIEEIKEYIDCCSLDNVISDLKALRNKYEDEYDKLHLYVSVESDYGYDYASIRLTGDRKETEEEALKREAKEIRDKENTEKSERAALIQLLNKYGVPV